MAGTIFINYRRGDSGGDARHLATLIGKQFPRRRIFLDTAGIAGGEHWLRMIQDQVAASDVKLHKSHPKYQDARITATSTAQESGRAKI